MELIIRIIEKLDSSSIEHIIEALMGLIAFGIFRGVALKLGDKEFKIGGKQTSHK